MPQSGKHPLPKEAGPSSTNGDRDEDSSDFASDYPNLRRWGRSLREQHSQLWSWVLRARAVSAWVGVIFLAGLYIFSDTVRAVAHVYFGCAWLLLLWFVTARTKTVSWALLSGFTGFCVFFAPAIAWITTKLAEQAVAQSSQTVFGGIPTLAAGSRTAIAGFGEESLKLLPLAALVFLLPRAARRWSITDWLLLSFAAGLAFQLFEDSARQLRWATRIPSNWDVLLPDNPTASYPNYGLGWSSASSDFSLSGQDAFFPGHHINSAFIGAGIGFAMVLWRSRRPGWFLAPGLPLISWWLASCLHFGANATLAATQWTTHPRKSTPDIIIWTWAFLDHGRWLASVVVSLFFLAIWVDALRLSRADRPTGKGTSEPDSAQPAGLIWLGRSLRAGRRLFAELPLWGYTRAAGESRLAAMSAGAAAASQFRRQRVAALSTLAGPRPRTSMAMRGFGLALLASLLLGALVLAPALAVKVGPWLDGSPLASWLASILDGLGEWWGGLSTGEQAVVLLAIGAAVGLMTCGLGPALYATGLASYGLGHARGLADFSRNPGKATRDYFSHSSPQRVLLDGVEFLATSIPAGAGLFFGRGIKVASSRYAADPDAFRAARKLAPSDAGTVRFDNFGNPRPNTWPEIIRDWRAGRKFNLAQNHRFEANEVTLLNRKRLDSYNHGTEIVSRKMSQLADLDPATAKYYLQEITRKYSPGEVIADTVKARSQYPQLARQKLEGRMFLELPIQNRPVPPEILTYASDRRIFIRDITGHIYR